MYRFGISVYPDLRPLSEIREYMALAARCGCRRVFSSMWSVEGNRTEVLACFEKLIGEAHALGLLVSLDVNASCLRRFGASPSDLSLFNALGCDILRMDVPLATQENLEILSNPYGISLELNASMGEGGARRIEELVQAKADVSRLLLCHNFYPQRYTGMRWARFLESSRRLSRLGIPIGAFITSQAAGTHGVWDARDGLCTVERHRDLPLELQARELMAAGCVTDILVGNAYAAEEELKALAEAAAPFEDSEDNPMHAIMRAFGAPAAAGGELLPKKLRVTLAEEITDLEKEVLFSFYPHRDVGDSSEWIWRSRMPRMVYKDSSIPVRPYAADEFRPGDVVIVNDAYKHYAAEIQIVRRPICNDGRRNLIGRLAPQEWELLNLIGDGDIVVFLPSCGNVNSHSE